MKRFFLLILTLPLFAVIVAQEETISNHQIKNAAQVVSCEYWIDNNYNDRKQISVDDSLVSFAIDAAQLKEGLHTLSLCVYDDLGNRSALTTWVFYRNGHKRPSKINWYKYWWNNHQDKAVKVMTECDSMVYIFSEELTIPNYAKTDGYSRNSTARFHIVFGDDIGNISSLEYADISYPDNIPPISTIEAEKQSDGVRLTWSANEDEIEFYNIYVSENDSPFFLWIPNTEKTEATFRGRAGVEYRFTITACDKAGNKEALDENKMVKVKVN